MRIYEVMTHMRKGMIAKCKKSYFALDEDGNLVRINSKELTIQGIAVIDGTFFATDKWMPIYEFPVRKGE